MGPDVVDPNRSAEYERSDKESSVSGGNKFCFSYYLQFLKVKQSMKISSNSRTSRLLSQKRLCQNPSSYFQELCSSY